MKNAENNHMVGKLQKDKLEAKEYVDVRSNNLGEHMEKYGESLMGLVASKPTLGCQSGETKQRGSRMPFGISYWRIGW